jgi:alpha-beta hydrolase superfamily lysophospholipase
VFAAGVSMGGFVVARAAIEYPKLFADGVVLLCPMLSLKKLRAHASNRIILKILRLFSIFTPTWEVGKTHKNKKFPLCQKEMEDDPLCWPSGVRGIRARTASECYFGTVRLNKPGVIEKFTHPVIAFHSVEDPMTDCSGSESFIERCRSKDKTMVRCSDAFHHDLQHVSGYSEPIGEEMCQWLAKRA